MILKVAKQDGCSEEWVFIGDIKTVSMGKVFLQPMAVGEEPSGCLKYCKYPPPLHPKVDLSPDLQKVALFHTNLPRLDERYLEKGISEEVQKGIKTFATISVVRLSFRNGTHKRIAYQLAYLLNDEGKTIERLPR